VRTRLTKLHGTHLRDSVLERTVAILRCAADCGVAGLILFGSVARGTAGTESDIDFWVATPGPSYLGGCARLQRRLSLLFCRAVHISIPDLLPEPLKSELAVELLKDGIPLDRPGQAALRLLSTNETQR
jgi:predicted nucleotidyltransferase